MAAILNSAMLDSSILHKKTSLIHSQSTWWWQPSWTLPCWIQTLPSWIETPCYHLSDSLQKHSHSNLTLTQINSIWLKLIHSHLNLMMAAIFNSAILNSSILYSAILTIPLKLNSHLPRSGSHHFQKEDSLIYSDSNLMMAAILNLCHIEFSHLWIQPFCTQTNSIWLIIHSLCTQLDDGSHLQFWPCWDSDILVLASRILTHTCQEYLLSPFALKNTYSHLHPDHLNKTNSIWLKLIHSHLTWWRQPSWILPYWIQPSWDSAILHKTLTQTNSIWLKLLHSHSTWWWQPSSISAILDSAILHKINFHSFILTQLDDGSHFEILPCWIQPFCTKLWLKLIQIWLKFIHSHLTSWCQPSKTLASWIFPLCSNSDSTLIQSDSTSFILHSTWWWQPSWILPFWIQPSWIQPFCTKLWLKLIQSDSNSFILTQLDDGSHLEFCHAWSQPFWTKLWFKLIQSVSNLFLLTSTWWRQSFWILPCWIQTLPSWIQTPCYHLSDSLKNTLTPLWPWIKLIQSDSNSFLLT